MIYLVMGIGEMDCSDWVVKAFRSEDRAREHVAKCQEYARAGCADHDTWVNGTDDSDAAAESARDALIAWRKNGPDASGYAHENATYAVREVEFVEEIEGA